MRQCHKVASVNISREILRNRVISGNLGFELKLDFCICIVYDILIEELKIDDLTKV